MIENLYVQGALVYLLGATIWHGSKTIVYTYMWKKEDLGNVDVPKKGLKILMLPAGFDLAYADYLDIKHRKEFKLGRMGTDKSQAKLEHFYE